MRAAHPFVAHLSSVVALLASIDLASAARERAWTEIEPGASTMSAEERALQADPAARAEHAVILVEETDRDDNYSGGGSRVRYHLRAKILSAEGRSLGDVEIPAPCERVQEWWGRVIGPDGKLTELPRTRLESQTMAEQGSSRYRVCKAPLSGLVAGSVIDYGYVTTSLGLEFPPPVALQREHPLHRFRYRWRPIAVGILPAYISTNGARELELDAKWVGSAAVIEGSNFPPRLYEPFGPPRWERDGYLVLYYVLAEGDESSRFWKAFGKKEERLLSQWLKRKKPFEEAIAKMAIPPGATLEQKLKLAYDWLQSAVRNTGLRSREELESEQQQEEDDGKVTPATLLESGQGSSYEIARLYVGFARMLGADANLAFTVDRTERYWMPDYLSQFQFDGELVAVRERGEPIERSGFVSPGSGLPFGLVPWWFTGVRAPVVHAEGVTPIGIPSSSADQNVARTAGRLAFAAENTTLTAEWKLEGEGQVGLSERRDLRNRAPKDREDRLQALCGHGGEFSVGHSVVPQLEAERARYALECNGERPLDGLDESIGIFRFSPSGPWFEAYPWLTAESKRHYPLIFEFPRTDAVELVVESPAGFAPDLPPEAINLVSQFGQYSRVVKAQDGGFTIQRTLKLTSLLIGQELFSSFVSFLTEVRKADSQPVTFRRAR